MDQPLYYGGKWWARRLAVVTRWMIHRAARAPSGVILDPFAGSGTTLGEAIRLGHRAIGIEVNGFASLLAEEAFRPNHPSLEASFLRVAEEALNEVAPLYGGENAPTAYFWSYEVTCPTCEASTLLLKRFVLVQHAYPKRFPAGWVLCPHSRHVFPVKDVSRSKAKCPCGRFVPLAGIRDGRFRCVSCGGNIGAIGQSGDPPQAVLVAVERRSGGRRVFQAPAPVDVRRSKRLDPGGAQLAPAPIHQGRSTRQILDWGYRDWADLFHPRQRALASAITRRIAIVRDRALRRELALAFSPFFEYHCRLVSFKGLGTGAVRQAFGRPLLHPVSVSFEMNPGFSDEATSILPSGSPRSWYTLRTARAAEALRELEEARGASLVLGSSNDVLAGSADLAVICADSSSISLPPESIDAVVTDPPYFNRVHYDDLAGALNAWLAWCGAKPVRNGGGVQSDDRITFSDGAYRAFRPAVTALKPDGRVTFTFHHQELDAWLALADALNPLPLAGADVVLVPGEMPNALMKSHAKNPLYCDALLFFEKRARQTTLYRAEERAVRLALKVWSQCPAASPADIVSAAYGAALVVGLKSADAPPDWAMFLDDVRRLVEASVSTEGANGVA